MFEGSGNKLRQGENNAALLEANDMHTHVPSRTNFSASQLAQLGGVCNAEPAIDDLDPHRRVSALHTYFGQFITHDIAKFSDETDVPQSTFKHPLNPANDIGAPFTLQSLYGDNHTGMNKRGLFRIEAGGQPRFDIPRKADGTPDIADIRNDQNLLISQFTHLWMRYHNHLVRSGLDLEAAKNKVRRVYYHLVKHDFLKNILFEDIWTLYFGDQANPALVKLDIADSVIPAAFHAAAFRFGHGMVRQSYGIGERRGVRLDIMMAKTHQATGSHRIDSNAPMDPRFRVDWDVFIEKNLSMQLSGKVPFSVPHVPDEHAMATRNMMRAHSFGVADAQTYMQVFVNAMPSLQQIFKYFAKVPEFLLADFSLRERISDPQVFSQSTPLWFYIMREAAYFRSLTQTSDMYTKKGILGPLGSLIVGQVFYRLFQDTPTEDSEFSTIQELARFTESLTASDQDTPASGGTMAKADRKFWTSMKGERVVGQNSESFNPDSYLPADSDTVVSFEYEKNGKQVMNVIILDEFGNIRIRAKEYYIEDLGDLRLVWRLDDNAVRVLDFGIQRGDIIRQYVVAEDDKRFSTISEQFGGEQMVSYFEQNEVKIAEMNVARWIWREVI